MCGIVGYLGEKNATPILLEGLKKLEYRGYDSAGIAVEMGTEIEVIKEMGKLEKLEEIISANPPEGTIGIGHTRWATHGSPSKLNSHPHYDCNGNFVVVHNGIIENFQQLKDDLEEKGHRFISETDTEVIAHLIEEKYQGSLKDTVFEVIKMLEGSYALGIMTKAEPDKILAVRQDSPLIIGRGKGENYIASDIPAFLQYTDEFIILDDGEIAEVTRDDIRLYNQEGEEIEKAPFIVDWDPEMAEKNGYDHFMLKEIYEQPDAIRRVLSERIAPGEVKLDQEISLLKDCAGKYEKVQIIACGTAYYSGMIGKYVIEELARIPVEVEVASEFRYRKPIIDDKTLVIVVSQSGETADTLAGLRLAQKEGARVLAITNVVGSSIAREADEVFYLHAGPEIAVASTKAYITMVTSFYLLAVHLAEARSTVSGNRLGELIQEILRLPELAAEIIRSSKSLVAERAVKYKNKEDAFFIGRNTDFTMAMEGALKLKEISYLHAEAYPAGELKHGPLALIEEGVPVVAITTRVSLHDKMLSNIKEVKARGADVTAVAFKGDREIEKSVDSVIYLPEIDEIFSGVLAIIPLQLLAYYTALEKDLDVDQPRNLAKSVTVE